MVTSPAKASPNKWLHSPSPLWKRIVQEDIHGGPEFQDSFGNTELGLGNRLMEARLGVAEADFENERISKRPSDEEVGTKRSKENDGPESSMLNEQSAQLKVPTPLRVMNC